MNKVRITAIRQTVYTDLMAKYENPIEHTCDVREGQQWISIDGQKPEGMCPSAWYSMREFVESLARGEGNFYDGWMKNPMSAMISCNDGFRPFSFYIEVTDEETLNSKDKAMTMKKRRTTLLINLRIPIFGGNFGGNYRLSKNDS